MGSLKVGWILPEDEGWIGMNIPEITTPDTYPRRSRMKDGLG